MTTIHVIACMLLGCFTPKIDFNPFRNFRPVPTDQLVDPFAELATYYGPQPAHPVAYECTWNDYGCIAKHDEAVLTLAVMTADRLTCARSSTHPATCLRAYDAVFRTWSHR